MCADGSAIDPARLRDVVAALDAGDVDAALESGLMELACADCLDRAKVELGDRERILVAAVKLRFAWDARERYRARQHRLAERARRRDARRAQASSPDVSSSTPALPTAAANALAKALARAKGQ
ncbi:hypothetical protein [Solilutibacter silvestris]|uniref:hypothetical protein n=1 Tax=Solilutibacter silvestris TaxID=1645665 RepID=UPI000CA0282F|nr:hypothetical protein [Lysobacter silvestris]